MKRLIAALLTALAVPVMITATTYAWNPFGGLPCNAGQQGSSSAVCKDANNPKNDPVSGSNGVLFKIVNLIAVLAGVAAIIIIVLAGLRFIQSGGNADEVAKARRSIIYASIGIVFIVIARSLIALALGAL